ncbi:unnamed protein product [Urochloa humidicola]
MPTATKKILTTGTHAHGLAPAKSSIEPTVPLGLGRRWASHWAAFWWQPIRNGQQSRGPVPSPPPPSVSLTPLAALFPGGAAHRQVFVGPFAAGEHPQGQKDEEGTASSDAMDFICYAEW